VLRHLKKYHGPLLNVLLDAQRRGILFQTAGALKLGQNIVRTFGVCGGIMKQSGSGQQASLLSYYNIQVCDRFVRHPKPAAQGALTLFFAKHHIGYAAADDPALGASLRSLWP
jgi:hypothetical protein